MKRLLWALAALAVLIPVFPSARGVAASGGSSLQAQDASCADGIAPNITGTVTDPNGEPYPTTVRLRGSAVSSPSFPVGENEIDTQTTTSSGGFAFCFDVFGNPDVSSLQVIAFALPSDFATTGTKASSFVSSGDCIMEACVIDVQLGSPTIKIAMNQDIASLRITRSVGDSDQIIHDGPLRDGNTGSFASSLEVGQSVSISVYPVDGNRLPISDTFVYDGTVIEIAGDFPQANFYGRLKKDTGEYLDSSDAMPTIYIARLHGENCSQGMDPNTLFGNGCISQPSVPAVGRFATNLASDGLYAISLTGGGFATTTAYFNFTEGVASILGGSIQAVDGGYEITLSTGTLKFVVQDFQGNPIEIGTLTALRPNQEGYYSGFYGGPTRLSDGRYGWSPTESGSYRFDVSAGSLATAVYLQVSVSPPGITATCRYSNEGVPVTTCDQQPLSQDQSGNWIIVMPPGDVKFSVCGIASGTTECGNPIIDGQSYFWTLSSLILSDNGLIFESNLSDGRELRTSTPELPLPDPASGGSVFRIRFVPPWQNQNAWAVRVIDLRVNDDGSIDRCGAFQLGVLCSDPVALDASSGVSVWPGQIRLERGNFVARIVRGDCESQCTIANASAQTFGTSGNSITFIANEQGGVGGVFSAHLAPGSYLIKGYPDESAKNDGYSEGSISVVVGSDGSVESVDGEAPAGPIVDLVLPPSNIVGTLLAGDEVVARANVRIEQWDSSTGGFQWLPRWADTDLTGSFKTSVGEGIWRIVADPNSDYASRGFAQGHLVVRVASGVVTQAGPCVQNVAAICVNPEELVVRYEEANLRGFVKRTDPTNGVVPAGNLGIGLRVFDSSAGYYRGIDGTGTRADGSFGFSVNPGRYQLNISKPSGVAGAAAASFLVVVTDSGSCVAESSQQTTCSNPTSSLDFLLPQPNFVGTVESSSNGKRAFLRIAKWESDRWNWEQAIFERSDASTGAFAVSLDDGQYQLIAEPDSALDNTLSQTTEYFEVSGSSWCRFEPIADTPPVVGQCDSMSTGSATIELLGSNYSGLVETSNGTPVRFGRVEVYRVYGDGGAYSEYLGTRSISYNGQFTLRVEYPDSGVNTVDIIDLVVHPDSNGSTPLARKKIRLWLGNFDGGAEKDDLCRVAPTGSTCSQLVSGTQTIVVNSGNLSGTVVKPNSGEVAKFSAVQAERTDGGGSPTDRWRWINVTESGTFSTSLEVGEWRLTARPPRGESSLASGSVAIVVVNDSKWCLKTAHDESGDACSQPNNFQLSLKAPNVSATVLNGQNPQNDVWINVEILRTNGQNTWWEWIPEGASTGTSGSFALDLPDGSYRISVNPPYNNTQGLVRFTREFTVTAGVSNLQSELSYPTANLVTTVQDPAGSAVRRAWVYVEKYENGSWRWANINAESSATGRVSLNVPTSGRYRLVVQPPSERTDLARMTREFEVTVSNDVLTYVGAAVPSILSFPAPNFAGRVTVDGTNASRHGWIEIFDPDSGDWITGTGTGEVGRFALLLPVPLSGSKTYRARVHPNYQSSIKTPIEVMVTIDSDGLISKWWYASDSSETDRCAGSPCSIDVNMGFDPPNVAVEVASGGEPVAGAFVRFERLTGTGGTPTGEVFETVTDDNGDVALRLPFPSGGTAYYKMTVVQVVGDAVTSRSEEISVNGSTSTAAAISVTLA